MCFCIFLFSSSIYYLSSFFWNNLTILGGPLTFKEQFIDAVEGYSPIVFLIILLIGTSFYGKRHFKVWGWKERCGVFFSAVLGIVLDIAIVLIWKRLN